MTRRSISRIIRQLFYGLFVIGLISLSSSGYAAEYTIAVVQSRAIGPYKEALMGFKDGMKKAGKINYEEFDLEKIEKDKKDFLNQLDGIKPDLIFTLGAPASKFVKEETTKIPVVFSMVLNPIESKVVDNLSWDGRITGVSLNIPVDAQFKELKRLLPALNKVGMLYEEGKKDRFKEDVQKATSKTGLTLVARPVSSQGDILSELKKLLEEVDALWGGADAFIYSAKTAQPIILETLRKQKPFMIFSPSFVKAGALVSLECDYADIGRQAGSVAMDLLNGNTPGSSVHPPRKTNLILNEKTVDTIDIDIPKEVQKEVHKTFGK